MAGLGATGFTIKTFTEIKAAIEAKIKAVISPYANTLPESVFGQLTTISSDGLSELWDLMQAVYNGNCITATGVTLDNVAAACGKRRKAATVAKIADFRFTFTGAATVPAGSTFTSAADGRQFELLEDVVAGGAGNVLGDVYAVVAGSFSLSDDEVTIIDSPVANLSAVTNPAASTYYDGTDAETDAELRIRIQTTSNSRYKTTDAVASTILDLNDERDTLGILPIDAATVIVNENHIADADGRPPHSIEVVTYYVGSPDAATDAAIARQIALTKADGIETTSTTFSSYTETVDVDDYTTRDIVFSRADEKDIYVIVTTTPTLTAAQKTALKAHIAAWGNTLGIGADVIVSGSNSLNGTISDWTGGTITSYTLTLGFAPAPGASANLTIDPTEISIWDTANITVN